MIVAFVGNDRDNGFGKGCAIDPIWSLPASMTIFPHRAPASPMLRRSRFHQSRPHTPDGILLRRGRIPTVRAPAPGTWSSVVRDDRQRRWPPAASAPLLVTLKIAIWLGTGLPRRRARRRRSVRSAETDRRRLVVAGDSLNPLRAATACRTIVIVVAWCRRDPRGAPATFGPSASGVSG